MYFCVQVPTAPQGGATYYGGRGDSYAPVRDLLGAVRGSNNRNRLPSSLSPAPVVYPPPAAADGGHYRQSTDRDHFKQSFRAEVPRTPDWTPVNTPSSNPLYY